MIFCVTVFVCPQSPYRNNDMIFWNFLLSFDTHFACDIGQSAKIFRFEFHLRSSPSAFCGYGRAVDLITSLLATPCWRYPARSKQRLTSLTMHESSEIKQITVKDNWTSANVQFSGSVTSGPTELPNTEKEKISPTIRDTMTKGTRVTWDESKAKLPWQTESGNIAV